MLCPYLFCDTSFWECGSSWRWQPLLPGILHSCRNTWNIFFLYNQSSKSQGGSNRGQNRRSQETGNSLRHSWLYSQMEVERDGDVVIQQECQGDLDRALTRVTWVPTDTLVWAKGSWHNPAAPFQRAALFSPVSKTSTLPWTYSPKASSHVMFISFEGAASFLQEVLPNWLHPTLITSLFLLFSHFSV